MNSHLKGEGNPTKTTHTARDITQDHSGFVPYNSRAGYSQTAMPVVPQSYAVGWLVYPDSSVICSSCPACLALNSKPSKHILTRSPKG